MYFDNLTLAALATVVAILVLMLRTAWPTPGRDL
jgi:hypothetical protein